MTIHWKTDPAPTGLYRSFFKRGWPTGWSDRNQTYPIASIRCTEEYLPAKVKTNSHPLLKVVVAICNNDEDRETRGSFTWRTLKGEWSTLAEAKTAAAQFYASHCDLFMDAN